MRKKISIRPGISILSVLKHLNYRPWYALAEYVDNAIESYEEFKKELIKTGGRKYKLKVTIELNKTDKKIIIRDNAAGIHKKDFARAFRAAELPPKKSGLAEFGMGMKSASCWFTNNWKVITTALGEDNESTIVFDINKIVHDKLEELDVKTKKANKKTHYTVIELLELGEKFPQTKTFDKIKSHLSSIYREFIRKGKLELIFDNETLKFDYPKILKAPFYKEEKGRAKLWRKDITYKIGKCRKVKGFVAIRETAATAEAGFALFRRGRVIMGSGDEGYRPKQIFGSSNSFAYQRIFGELHLVGFGVSHTKDGIQWERHEEEFLLELKKLMQKKPIQIITQSEGYRKRASKKDYEDAANKTFNKTEEVFRKQFPEIIESLKSGEKKIDDQVLEKLKRTGKSVHRIFEVEIDIEKWNIYVELSYDESITDWIEVSDSFIKKSSKNKNREVGIRLNLIHPFMQQFTNTDPTKIEPLLRIVAAIGLAETMARDSGVSGAGSIRTNINQILKEGLSNPD